MGDGIILMITAFGAISSLVLLVGLLATRKPDPVEARVGSLSGSDNPQSAIRNPQSVRAASPAEEKERQGLGDRLVQAGLYKRNSISFYLATQVVLLAIPAAISLIAWGSGWLTALQALLLGIFTGISGILAPSFWLDAKKRSRQTQLRRALPDALDVIVVCMEAGLSLPAAFTRVSSELRTAHPMLAAEMIIVQREIQMGHSTGEALKNFANRFDVEELRSLAAVILQAEKYGASIVQALRVHAEDLRTKRHQRAEEKAQQAAVKLLIPTVFCIFPALFIVILGPAAFDIYELLIKGVFAEHF